MSIVKDLYLNGLVFLDFAWQKANDEISNKIINTFFGGEVTHYKINVLKALQKSSKNLILMRNIVKMCIRMVEVQGLDIPISVEYIHSSETILPVHMISDITPFNNDIDIYISRIIIPVYHDHVTNIDKLYNAVETLYKKDSVSVQEVYKQIGSLFEPLYFTPTGDRNDYYVQIDYSRLVPETNFYIGSFTSTATSRVTLIGDNIYIENIENDSLYYNRIYHTDADYEMQLLSVYDRFKVSKNTESIKNFIENKRRTFNETQITTT